MISVFLEIFLEISVFPGIFLETSVSLEIEDGPAVVMPDNLDPEAYKLNQFCKPIVGSHPYHRKGHPVRKTREVYQLHDNDHDELAPGDGVLINDVPRHAVLNDQPHGVVARDQQHDERLHGGVLRDQPRGVAERDQLGGQVVNVQLHDGIARDQLYGGLSSSQ